MKHLVTKFPITTYLGIAFSISWISGYISYQMEDQFPAGVILFFTYLAKFGPSLGALVTVLLLGGGNRVKTQFASIIPRKITPGWLVIALGSQAVLWSLVVLFISATSSTELAIELSAAGLIFLLILKHFFLGGGLGEELGWRGFMLPRLQARYSALTSSLFIGLVWGLWHGPKFLWDDGGGVGTVIIFTIYTTVLAIIFTAVFNRSGGNLFVVTLLHASMNATNGYVEALIPAIAEVDGSEIYLALCWLVIAIAIIIIGRPRSLAGKDVEKMTL
jgi:membrane protease YdiL (CAAX protease family)